MALRFLAIQIYPKSFILAFKIIYVCIFAKQNYCKKDNYISHTGILFLCMIERHRSKVSYREFHEKVPTATCTLQVPFIKSAVAGIVMYT